jgi:type II secretory pathway component GspD/PulD (secretin)
VMRAEDVYIQPERGLVILIGSQEVLSRAEEIIAALDKPKPQPEVVESLDIVQVPEASPPEMPGYQVKVYRLNYADPETARDALTLIVDEGRMRLDRESQGIVVRATEAELEEIEGFLAQFDKPIPQVILEVWVQEMSTDAMRTLGIDWEQPVSFHGGTGVPKFFELNYEPWNLFLAIRALEDEGKAKLLANPKISTLSGKPASIFVGDRVPVAIKDEEGNITSMQYLEAGINLNVTPRVSNDGSITIQVRPEVSSFIWQTESQFPQIRTRQAETVVRVKDGQPVVIGGLLQEEDHDSLVQIPILAQLPLLGQLFQWREKQTQQTEMTIFLIPRLVGDGAEAPDEAFFTSAQ